MESGKLQSTKSKTRRRIKRALVMLAKGGDIMYEARQIGLETMKNLAKGKMPNTPAKVMSTLLYGQAMNQFAETAMLREIGRAELTAELIEAGDKFNEIAG